jgi:hypothetical protein
MAIPLLHTVVSWLLKKRVHDIELFIKYPNEVQRDELMNLLQTAKKTEVGKQYGFADIQQYEDFANRVPVRTYEEIAPMIERSRQGSKIYFGLHLSNGTPNRVVRPMPKASLFPSQTNL